MFSPAPWKWEDDKLVDAEGNEVIGIFPAHGDKQAWLMVNAEKNQLLIQHAPELYEALRFYVEICGNTGYAVSRENFKLMYDMGVKALKSTKENE